MPARSNGLQAECVRRIDQYFSNSCRSCSQFCSPLSLWQVHTMLKDCFEAFVFIPTDKHPFSKLYWSTSSCFWFNFKEVLVIILSPVFRFLHRLSIFVWKRPYSDSPFSRVFAFLLPRTLSSGLVLQGWKREILLRCFLFLAFLKSRAAFLVVFFL